MPLSLSTTIRPRATREGITMQSMTDIWEFTEQAPDYAAKVADLWHWSTNYDAGKGPITLYLDLIGWSEDNIGETLFDLTSASLGYLELDKLAGALSEYTARPTDVRAWVDELMGFDEA
jgi:hypothetical protein